MKKESNLRPTPALNLIWNKSAIRRLNMLLCGIQSAEISARKLA